MKSQLPPVHESFPEKYSVAPEAVVKNALAANNPVFQKPAILVTFMGHHPQIKARAAYAPGNVGIGRQRTSHCVVLQAGLSPPTRAGKTDHSQETHYATTNAPQTGHPHARASLRWWTKSRCDSVCLRSRHFVAWLRRGLAHDAMAIQTTQLSQGFTKLNA